MARSRPNGVDVRTLDTRVRQILDSRLEHKRVTALGSAADLATAGVINSISSNLAQGDDINGRTGDVVRVHKLRVKYTFINSDSLASFYTGRIIIFQDTLANGALANVTDVLDSANPMSGYKPVYAQSRRFKILLDRTVNVIGATNRSRVTETVDLRVPGTIHYIGSAAANASLGKNTLNALFISDLASAGKFQYVWSYDYDFTDA